MRRQHNGLLQNAYALPVNEGGWFASARGNERFANTSKEETWFALAHPVTHDIRDVIIRHLPPCIEDLRLTRPEACCRRRLLETQAFEQALLLSLLKVQLELEFGVLTTALATSDVKRRLYTPVLADG